MQHLSLREQFLSERRKNEALKASQIDSDKVSSIAFVMLAQTGVIDEVTASEHIGVFNEWQANISYAVGTYVRHNDILYKCVQAHTSQVGWEPEAAASLWNKTGDPAEEYPAWSQPLGAHDVYDAGDKVTHNSKKWVSIADSNVWEPGVYGWDEVVE